MSESTHWTEDAHWMDALKHFHDLRDGGATSLTLDIAAIEEGVFDADEPADRLMEAMVSANERAGHDDHQRVQPGAVADDCAIG